MKTGAQEPAASPPAEPMRLRLLHSRLIHFMSIMEDSAVLAYSRRLQLLESLRRLLFLLGLYRGLTSSEIAVYSGSEKAQISRGIKALAEQDLIERPRLRSRIRLNGKGERLFAEIMAIVEERNAVLIRGFAEPDISRFIDLTKRLIERAAQLYAQEGAVPDDGAAASTIFHPPPAQDHRGPPFGPGVVFGGMVMPGLQSLLTYLQRSGAQIFRREVGLTNFEWRVLSQLGEYQPITLAKLVTIVGRDKSQIARTLKALQERGLARRQDRGRLNIALRLTGEGETVYERMCGIAVARDDHLFRGSSADDRGFYIGMLERLTVRAQEMLAAERAQAATRPGAASADAERAGAQPPHDELEALRDENTRLKQLLAEAILENSRMLQRRGRAPTT